jgi:putative transposase
VKDATLVQISAALNITKRAAAMRADREGWSFKEETGRGGIRRVYQVNSLPTELQAALALMAVPADLMPTIDAGVLVSYDREALYVVHAQRPEHLRETGARRAAIVRQVKALQPRFTLQVALNQVGIANEEKPRTIERWIYAVKDYHEADWHVALTPAYKGSKKTAEIAEEGWDWIVGHYLTRKQPTLKESYRRLRETANKNNWNIPSIDTVSRRLEEIPLPTRVLLREGEEALAKLYPPQRRDKTVFAAGEAVTGDGLKFDNLWVMWPDGELLNTSTGWFWGDIRTAKILAYRLAKTENTDLFRLATYDLTGICRPSFAWVDNTVVAANKAMTGRSGNRHRFHDKENDPIGLLQHIGMEVRFTNPDKVMGSPGAKPIERSFGIGGIHEMVAKSPRLKGKGFSRATAIPYALFAEIVAEEVQRFNARPNRRSAVCGGKLSYDEAFAQSFQAATVVKLSDSQRQILLLMPEVVRANKRSGEISLKAGRGPMGRNRFWSEALLDHMGEELIAYFDPENIAGNPVSVYTLDGRFLCTADHLGDVAFNDTTQAREWAKNKSRFVKATKLAGKADQRMNELEVAATYPAAAEAPAVPQPGVVRGNFQQKRVVRQLGNQEEADKATEATVAMFAERREPDPAGMEISERYAYWCQLDEQLARGEQLSERAAKFHAHYQNTEDFKAFKSVEEDLGGGFKARA